MSADPSVATWLAVILLALISCVTTAIGVGLALWLGDSARGIATGVGFSAGIMILVSIAELIPESVREAGPLTSLLAVALGAGVVASLHLIVPHTHLIEEKGTFDARLLRGAYLVAFGPHPARLPGGLRDGQLLCGFAVASTPSTRGRSSLRQAPTRFAASARRRAATPGQRFRFS